MDKYYKEIKDKLIDEEVYSKAKDYSKERHKVVAYYETGKLLLEAGSKYGDSIIENYSKKLVNEVGKKYSARTLRRMRQFYEIFSNFENWSPSGTNLNWSHYRELLPLKEHDKIRYYIKVCLENSLSKTKLHERIKNKEYERLDDKTKEKIINNDDLDLIDTLKNPILIKNSYNMDINIISEKFLQMIILEDISSFMNELGEGFCFIKEEYPIRIGSRYNYIDLLLYNYLYNSFVVIELKVTEVKKEHIGQISVYMNYIDKHVKSTIQNKTIGIIIAKENNEFGMSYCSDPRITSRVYELI